MSDPFRSEVAALAEQVARQNEEISQLRSDKQQLESRLSFTQKPGRLVGLVSAFSLAAAMLVGSFMWSKLRIEQQKEADLSAQLAAAEAQQRACAEARLRALGPLDPIAIPSPLPTAPKTKKTTRCTCVPGDPLCTCVE